MIITKRFEVLRWKWLSLALTHEEDLIKQIKRYSAK